MKNLKHFISGIVIIMFVTLSCSGTDNKLEREKGINLLTYSHIEKALEICSGKNIKVAIIDWMFDMNGKSAEKYINPVSMVSGEAIGSLKPWHGEWMAEITHQVAPKSKIIPIRARSLKTRKYEEFLIKGIYYAADNGAAAASSSMGPLKNSEALKKAIDYAESKGMIFVDVHPEYIIGKGGKKKSCKTGMCDERIIHTGIVSVPDYPVKPDPKRDIYTWAYDLDAKYEDGWGYSNAPPIVVGVIALMKSVNPGLTNNEIRRIIIETAEDRNGFKVLNALKAVKSAKKMNSRSKQ